MSIERIFAVAFAVTIVVIAIALAAKSIDPKCECECPRRHHSPAPIHQPDRSLDAGRLVPTSV